MLKFEIDQGAFEELEESVQGLYSKHGDGYRLQVDGVDAGDELREALRKERAERADAKKRLQELERKQEEAERARMEKDQEWEQLASKEREKRAAAEERLQSLEQAVAEKDRLAAAREVAGTLTRDSARGALLEKEALQYVHHTPEGVKFTGPDGEAWDAPKLKAYLESRYPFLVDGSGAAGGGAPGAGAGGGATKKFTEMTGAELKDLRQTNPAEYDRLKAEHNAGTA
jgi:multidrug efflux pump subunit AcrA (membrane-fusion protein)